jgi:hypothetical protein
MSEEAAAALDVADEWRVPGRIWDATYFHFNTFIVPFDKALEPLTNLLSEVLPAELFYQVMLLKSKQPKHSHQSNN